jgi:hypothetical protein
MTEKLVDVKELLGSAMKLIRRVGEGEATVTEVEVFPEVLKIVSNMCDLGDDYYAR